MFSAGFLAIGFLTDLLSCIVLRMPRRPGFLDFLFFNGIFLFLYSTEIETIQARITQRTWHSGMWFGFGSQGITAAISDLRDIFQPK